MVGIILPFTARMMLLFLGLEKGEPLAYVEALALLIQWIGMAWVFLIIVKEDNPLLFLAGVVIYFFGFGPALVVVWGHQVYALRQRRRLGVTSHRDENRARALRLWTAGLTVALSCEVHFWGGILGWWKA